jgi:hypothetical protein
MAIFTVKQMARFLYLGWSSALWALELDDKLSFHNSIPQMQQDIPAIANG